MATVWLANRGNHPGYYKAERFGKLCSVTEGRVNLFKNDNLARRIINSLEGNTSSEDYVVVSGYILVNFYVMAYFLLKYGSVRCLQWEGNRNDYSALHVDIRQFPAELLAAFSAMLSEVTANSETTITPTTGGEHECSCEEGQEGEQDEEEPAPDDAGAVRAGDRTAGADGGTEAAEAS